MVFNGAFVLPHLPLLPHFLTIQDLEFLEETPSEGDPTMSELETASIAESTASTVDTGLAAPLQLILTQSKHQLMKC